MSSPALRPVLILEGSYKMNGNNMLEKMSYDQKLEAANTLASICSATSGTTKTHIVPQQSQYKCNTNVQQQPTFPKKLMAIVSDPLHTDYISWLPEGDAFVIRDIKRFSAHILEEHFPATRNVSGFLKKLQCCGFKLISKGSKHLVYFHRLFRRDNPDLCSYINSKNVSSGIIGRSVPNKSEKKFTDLESNWVSADESSLSDCDSSYQSSKKNAACDESLSGSEHSRSKHHLATEDCSQNDSSEACTISKRKVKCCESSNSLAPSFLQLQQSMKNGEPYLSPPKIVASEMERAFLSFREYHKTIISTAIEALLQNRSDIRAVQGDY